ncbi:MAG: type II toxin-antitoxin system CcdA family antitoxin [Pseudomonadota bacterium]|uniref:type II toxin-antitoxin system CcdA family antitoxin n=1 Tax=Thermithiobacillus tepidarius TaxID=929 RepID=UPI00041175C7|nr:type II toxin-antitoxin system CcdA family antitoxin [Thermithiobacillus tepidarius]
MHIDAHDPAAPKKPVNLSINSDLLRQARALKINLSQTLEERLAELLREARRSQWLVENQAALDAYNRHIERHGAFSDGLRQF